MHMTPMTRMGAMRATQSNRFFFDTTDCKDFDLYNSLEIHGFLPLSGEDDHLFILSDDIYDQHPAELSETEIAPPSLPPPDGQGAQEEIARFVQVP